jgi:hypothetical protein
MVLGMTVSQYDKSPGDPNYYLYLEKYLSFPEVDFQFLVGDDFSNDLKKVAPSSVTGFQNYIQDYVLPNLSQQTGYPNSVQALANKESLTALSDFLTHTPLVYLMHNADDFLLQDGDIAFLQSTFPGRFQLYPHGGHVGNIWYQQNQSDLLTLLK